VHALVRSVVKTWDTDRFMAPDIEACTAVTTHTKHTHNGWTETVTDGRTTLKQKQQREARRECSMASINECIKERRKEGGRNE
jgi:hypothetical protein